MSCLNCPIIPFDSVFAGGLEAELLQWEPDVQSSTVVQSGN